MKDESAAEWLEQKFGDEGIAYYDNNNEEFKIKARQMGEVWKTITVRGVTPVLPIQVIDQHFKQFGEVKDIRYVEKGKLNVRSNKVTLKLKIDEGKQLPVFIWNKLKEGYYERWEVSYYGSPKVCLQCFQIGHLKRECGDLGPTITQIIQGEVTWAQVLGGKRPTPTPATQQSSMQPSKVPPTEPQLSSLQLPQPTGSSLPAEEDTGWEKGKSRRKAEKRKASPETRVSKKSEIELSNMFDKIQRSDDEADGMEEEEERTKEISNSGQEVNKEERKEEPKDCQGEITDKE